MRQNLITFFLALTCVALYVPLTAQTLVTGTITDTDRKVMPGGNITVKPKGAASLLSYAVTDDKGKYKLSFKTSADSIELSISGMSVKKLSQTYPNKSSNLNFTLSYESITLKEMKVKPPKIRRLDDTLNYDVEQFIGKNDRTIGDALKRMPGIEVAANGSITYNGKPINRFYIEDKDMLEGRYGIATNNLEAKDVVTVQVLENHQPIKALKDKEFTDDAAINLKLKETAKNVLVVNTQLGAGVLPLLWNNELFGMYFGKDKQFMATYKGNNTGDDSAAELQNFYGGGINIAFPVALAIQSPSGPGVSRKRYLLNQDNAVSLNNLRSLGKDYKLTTNISYHTDRQTKSSYSRVENFLPGDSTLVIEERIASLERFHYLDGTVKINANTDKFFFDNSIHFNGDLMRDEYGTVQNAQFIEQNRSAPYFRLSNNLSAIKSYRNTAFTINSYNSYGRINDGLDVRPMLYPDLFNDVGILTGLKQSVTQNVFYTANKLGMDIKHGKFTQAYTVGANASIVKLNSALQSLMQNTRGNLTDSLSNRIDWKRYDAFLSPKYTYGDKKANVSLSLPFTYVSQHSDDQINGTEKSLDRIFFTPAFSANYKLNLLWNLNASAGFNRGIDGLENGFTGYIMQSYRYLVQNEGMLPERSSQNYSVSVSHQHPITLVFGKLSGSYFRSKTNLLYGNQFRGFLAVRRVLEIPNSASGYNFSLYASKGFESVLRKVSFNAGFSSSENIQLNQTVITAFLNKSYHGSFDAESKLSEWAELNYNVSLGQSENIIKNDARDFSPISWASQGARLILFPVKNLTVRLNYDYSFNSAVTGSGRIMNFADAGIRYKLKKLDFNLEYNNVFNTRRYIIAAYNGIGSYYADYDLRPSQLLLKLRFKIK